MDNLYYALLKSVNKNSFIVSTFKLNLLMSKSVIYFNLKSKSVFRIPNQVELEKRVKYRQKMKN